MARIRTIKPEFFKHGDLQDLEVAHPGQYIMLVYAGLWTQCDRNAVFFCKARDIKNAILPYINFDMQKTLDILEKHGYFIKYKSGGREYGFIPNFSKYQFISTNEQKCPSKYPPPPENILETIPSTAQDVPENDIGNNTETTGLQDYRITGDRITGICPPESENSTAPQEFPTARAVDPKDTPVIQNPEQNKIAPVSRSPQETKKKRGIQLTDDQKPLFHAAKACFEADEKTKALMYQDRGSTQMYMENLKLFVMRCHNIAPGITADFMRNVLEHFRVMCGGKLKGRVEFTPSALITRWIWETVIGSLPKAEDELDEKIRESIKGMFQ